MFRINQTMDHGYEYFYSQHKHEPKMNGYGDYISKYLCEQNEARYWNPEQIKLNVKIA